MYKDKYIYRRKMKYRNLLRTQQQKRKTMPISIISHKECMDHYRKLLTEERVEYKIKTHIQIKGEKHWNRGCEKNGFSEMACRGEYMY